MWGERDKREKPSQYGLDQIYIQQSLNIIKLF
jgi:hypothetical protein